MEIVQSRCNISENAETNSWNKFLKGREGRGGEGRRGEERGGEGRRGEERGGEGRRDSWRGNGSSLSLICDTASTAEPHSTWCICGAFGNILVIPFYWSFCKWLGTFSFAMAALRDPPDM